MAPQTSNIELIIKDDYGFQIVRSYEDLETSDESHFSLVVFAYYESKDTWSTVYTHPLTDRKVISDSSDHMILGMNADAEAEYRAGPFTVKAADLIDPDAWSKKILYSAIIEIDFEVDERGRPVSSAMRNRREEQRAIKEQEAKDQASFEAQFRIDEDGHVYPRDLF